MVSNFVTEHDSLLKLTDEECEEAVKIDPGIPKHAREILKGPRNRTEVKKGPKK